VKLYISCGSEIPASFGPRLRGRKRTLVAITKPCVAAVLRAARGVPRVDEATEYLLEHGPGDFAVIKKSIFEATYEPVAQGRYRRKTIVQLVQVPTGADVVLRSLEGEVAVAHPNYIAIGAIDEVYPNSAEWVANNLELLPQGGP
jgi:hypothetical protein